MIMRDNGERQYELTNNLIHEALDEVRHIMSNLGSTETMFKVIGNVKKYHHGQRIQVGEIMYLFGGCFESEFKYKSVYPNGFIEIKSDIRCVVNPFIFKRTGAEKFKLVGLLPEDHMLLDKLEMKDNRIFATLVDYSDLRYMKENSYVISYDKLLHQVEQDTIKTVKRDLTTIGFTDIVFEDIRNKLVAIDDEILDTDTSYKDRITNEYNEIIVGPHGVQGIQQSLFHLQEYKTHYELDIGEFSYMDQVYVPRTLKSSRMKISTEWAKNYKTHYYDFSKVGGRVTPILSKYIGPEQTSLPHAIKWVSNHQFKQTVALSIPLKEYDERFEAFSRKTDTITKELSFDGNWHNGFTMLLEFYIDSIKQFTDMVEQKKKENIEKREYMERHQQIHGY